MTDTEDAEYKQAHGDAAEAVASKSPGMFDDLEKLNIGACEAEAPAIGKEVEPEGALADAGALDGILELGLPQVCKFFSGGLLVSI